jgi:hypothetical protein
MGGVILWMAFAALAAVCVYGVLVEINDRAKRYDGELVDAYFTIIELRFENAALRGRLKGKKKH